MPNFFIPDFKAPRVLAEINGIIVDDVIHANITMHQPGKSSSFALTVSMGSQSTNDHWIIGAARRTVVSLSVHMTGTEEKIHIFEGLADDIAFDAIGKVAHIRGRDYSAILAGATIQSSFSNLTASEIVSSIAEQHGFPCIITPTHSMAGSYRSGNYNQMLLNDYSEFTNQWHLVSTLANLESFDVFFEGGTLLFRPRGSIVTVKAQYTPKDFISLRFHRKCPLLTQTKISVKSWDSWLGQSVTHKEEQFFEWMGEADQAINIASENEVVLIKPNMSYSSAERLCKNYSQNISQNSLYVDATMQGETSLRPGDVIIINGTNTFFDQQYTIKSIDRRLSPDGGFLQHVRGIITTP